MHIAPVGLSAYNASFAKKRPQTEHSNYGGGYTVERPVKEQPKDTVTWSNCGNDAYPVVKKGEDKPKEEVKDYNLH